MVNIVQSQPFFASWDAANRKLNPENDNILWRKARKIKNFLFYVPNCAIAACVNPREETKFYPSAILNANYGKFTKEIVTPDQVHLMAHVDIAAGASADAPIVILFNPLGAGHEVHDNLKMGLNARRCHTVSFNYRGLGSTWRAEDLVVDGESVYQYVIQELGVKKNKVHFFGFSLGGMIALQVKALHNDSDGKYVGDRSPKSLFSLITAVCCIEKLGTMVKKITSFISALFIAYPVYLLGWEWDGSKAFASLSGDKLVIFHPNDILVPPEAKLASLCDDSDIITLNPSETGGATHFSPIENHSTMDQQSAVALVTDFLAD